MAGALGIAEYDIVRASIVDVGPVWFTLQVTEARTVVALPSDMAELAALAPLGVTGVTVFGLYRRDRPPIWKFAGSHRTPRRPRGPCVRKRQWMRGVHDSAR